MVGGAHPTFSLVAPASCRCTCTGWEPVPPSTFRHRKPLPSPPPQPPEAPGAERRNFFNGITVISFSKTGSFTKFPLFLSKKIGGVNTDGNGEGANFVLEAFLDSGSRGRL